VVQDVIHLRAPGNITADGALEEIHSFAVYSMRVPLGGAEEEDKFDVSRCSAKNPDPSHGTRRMPQRR